MRDDIRGLRGDNLSFARFVRGVCLVVEIFLVSLPSNYFLTSAVLTFQ